MRNVGVAGLSRQALQGALYRTTEHLASELVVPTATAPNWSAAEWHIAAAVAAIHGITSLLSATLRWEGPDSWREFLCKQMTLEGLRHRRIRELLQLIDTRLRSADVPAIGLKGAALYAGSYYDQSQRPMADIDILVRKCDLEPASEQLESLGFAESHRFWKNRVFSPCDARAPWEVNHPDKHPINIELHDRICEMLPAQKVDISARMFPVAPLPGLNSYPSTTALMMHLLLHAAGSMVQHALRLVQLHDIALVAKRLGTEDWAEVLRVDECERPWWVFPPLALTARYYQGYIPRQPLELARACCPALLRRLSARWSLSDVSLSFPWVEAFPGIAWAHSAVETLEYVRTRLLPGRQAAHTREVASSTEPALSSAERQWLQQSQGGRIVRWLLCRPARPLTMRAVRIAFGECP